ncbi:MAG: ABC transporter substrate-binding protein, partial [Candidatus Tectomicrobia bacterium]|nr:ABC transporter substrate-binding protein [Candidatus Tectomicrobia bacterium]
MIRLIRMQVALLLLMGLALRASSAPAEPVKITFLLPLRGVIKDLALSTKEGFLLGLEEEAKAHQIDDWKSLIILDIRDSRTDPEHSLKMAKEAISEGSRAILAGGSSKSTLNIRDYVLNEAGVPLIVFTPTSSKLRIQHPLFIRPSRSIPLLSTALAHWLIDHIDKVRMTSETPASKPRWACIHLDYSWGEGVCDGFTKAYGSVGEEVGRIPVEFKTLSKKKEIVKLTKLQPQPDFALVAITGAEAETFFRDYYRFNVHKKIPPVALYVAVLPARLRAYEKTLGEHDTAAGLVTASAYEPTIDNPPNHYLVAQYKKKYEGKLPDALAMWGYDGARLLIKALMQLDGKWDGAKVVELMKTLPYESPRHGKQLKFDTHGDPINPAHIQRTERDGD